MYKRDSNAKQLYSMKIVSLQYVGRLNSNLSIKVALASGH